jgi:xanthosine utilization system XapX-like protein
MSDAAPGHLEDDPVPATIHLPIGLLDMLVGEGLISKSTAIQIMNRVRESWIPIGEVLRGQGHLTTGELMDLVQLQAAEPHLRLGELAVREGFCKEEDLLDAVSMQRESNHHPLEILLADFPCDRDRLWNIVVRYLRQLESRLADLPSQH